MREKPYFISICCSLVPTTVILGECSPLMYTCYTVSMPQYKYRRFVRFRLTAVTCDSSQRRQPYLISSPDLCSHESFIFDRQVTRMWVCVCVFVCVCRQYHLLPRVAKYTSRGKTTVKILALR